jgi:hypothetical protein
MSMILHEIAKPPRSVSVLDTRRLAGDMSLFLIEDAGKYFCLSHVTLFSGTEKETILCYTAPAPRAERGSNYAEKTQRYFLPDRNEALKQLAWRSLQTGAPLTPRDFLGDCPGDQIEVAVLMRPRDFHGSDFIEKVANAKAGKALIARMGSDGKFRGKDGERVSIKKFRRDGV